MCMYVCMYICIYVLGLCDMDKKYISRFFDFFFDFDFNHDFDTNRHALSHILLVFAHLTCLAHLTCFCTSYLSCTSCFALFFILLHILLFISPFYLYICSCVVLLLYNFYSLHCPLSGPDLTYISLLIIPCIIYHVTNKETLNLYSYKCILCEFETYFQRKPIRPFPKSCNKVKVSLFVT